MISLTWSQDKLSESNFTLGAQSPDSDPELIGESDPLLGLIATAARPSTAASVPLTSDSDPVFDQLLAADVPLREPSTLDSTEFDLGFCFEDSLTPPIRNPLNTTAEGETAETLDAISEELEASLEDMIQTAQMHPRSLQVGTTTFCSIVREGD